ncbi:FIP (Fungus-Induced Protein) Related [Caenorhabditis elegans]|uniref:FIP (Fungus-Induced Protein) Related n=1 Tax=Caenorhabditis elegans TaxID=6239 RepID=Q4R136_CAEEL|nr:FIP (Fungus-Induced Protein) Related [Caenorhabditis elegans]CCD72347.1 FIP (Fungus-Induced Protein) Related [Caenorhabditis elegans]|eukprot:NP_001033367.1 FIP (Fungus-Induced Protein) Related [Caenorhabditis elegans]
MNFYNIFIFAVLSIAAVSGHRCRGGYSGGGRGRGGIVIGTAKE